MKRLSRTGVVIASVSEAIQESSGALRLLNRHVASLLAMTIPSERILVKRDSIATAMIGDG